MRWRTRRADTEGRKPRLSVTQEAHLVKLHHHGTHPTTEIAELFGIARSTMHRTLNSAGLPATATLGPGGALTG